MSTPRACITGWIVASLFALYAWLAPAESAEPTPESIEFFEKKVRPVLTERCYKCHSGAKDKGGLRLDSRAALLKGGETGPAIVPGHPEKSLLIKAIGYKDDLRMPPKTRLAADEVADLTTWVKMGAPWPGDTGTKGPDPKDAFNLKERMKHWCWQPIKPVEPPAVRQKDWPRGPIDQFILAKLEASDLKPASPADKRTLIRRATFDLIGLPPTVAEIENFLADESPESFEKVVDRLLVSPHYGERWGRHWLDLVRYAETHGHEFDYEIPEAHVYRDYIIRAFNADLPYDRLLVEHVAGDQLTNPRRHPTEGFNESIIGTGFWYFGEAKHSPVDTRIDEADRMDNQIDVFSKAFLGLTVSCARCHDHKFDAITTKDYHALMGYLQSSRRQRAFIDSPERMQVPLREWQELRSQVEPLAVAESARKLQTRAEKLAACLTASQSGRKPGPKAPDAATLERWTKALKKLDPKRPEQPLAAWFALTKEPLTPEKFAERRKQLVQEAKQQAERAAAFEKDATVFADFSTQDYRDWFVAGDAFGTAPSQAGTPLLHGDASHAIRTVLGGGAAHSGRAAGARKGVLRSKSFVVSKKKVHYRVSGQNTHVRLSLDGLFLIQSPIYGGLAQEIKHGDAPRWLSMDVSMWTGQRAYIEVVDDGAGFAGLEKILFADGNPTEAPNSLLLKMLDDDQLASPEALAQKYQDAFLELAGQWRSGALATATDAADRLSLLNWMLQSELLAALDDQAAAGPEREKLASLLDRLKKAEAALPAARRALAICDGNPWDAPVYIRGNPSNRGEIVPRRSLEALDGRDQPTASTGSGRLALAQNLVKLSNPLTARVMVNRIWKHHFGEGLVRSVDNFGVLGEQPSHPELLDWLATEFVRQGWSIKKMHRQMMLSRTYQMASRSDEARAAERDPQNRLLHRMPIRRLEAEAIRDAMLAVSGRLDSKLHGPSVMPHLTQHMTGRGRPGVSGPLDGDGRRSIYISVRRNFLTPMLLAFDYPLPFTTIGKRSVSNVPAQALALMNNPFVVQQSEAWSKRVLSDPKQAPKQRVATMYATAFGRPPSEAELTDALAFVTEQSKTYGKPDDPRAWADLCHVLFNVKEFVFVN